LQSEASAILIDPLLPNDPAVLRWIKKQCGGRSVHVLVTVYWHLRSAEIAQAHLGATVWGNAKTREGVENLVTGLIEDGVPLPGGVIPFTPIRTTAARKRPLSGFRVSAHSQSETS
jgi:hypothetical protein